MRSSDGRRILDWSHVLATVIGGLIATGAAFSAEYWKAHIDARADERALARLAQGSVRAWRDDLYEAEEVLGHAIASRRWTAEREIPLADVEDYKEVSRAASWETWRHVSAARHDLERQYRIWRTPRRLGPADVEALSDLLVAVERARVMLAREFDGGASVPGPHPIFREAGLQALLR